METKTDEPGKTHQGKNVKRFREMAGIRQEALADQLGPEWSQKRISLIEAREIVDPDLLNSIAEVLKIPVQVLENFNEQAAINYFNTFKDNTITNGVTYNANNQNNDLLDKVIDSMQELKMVYEQNRELFLENKELNAILLNLEREKNAALQAKLN